jgi:hypothetical protein
VPAALALAACSSSGAANSSETTSAPPAQTTTSAAAATSATTSAVAAADPYCAKLATFPAMLTKFQQELGAPKASKLKADVAEAKAYFESLQQGAPAELAPQLKTVVTTLDGVKSVDDIPMLTPKVLPIATAIQTYITTNCTAS